MRNSAMVLALLPPAIKAVAQSAPSLESQLIRAIRSTEPVCMFGPAFESGRVPIIPSETRVVVGIWSGPTVGKVAEAVGVHVYRVENTKEAIAWLTPVRSGASV
jgi:hypothetical protein